MKKTGIAASGLIWFGAAISIAEIETGFAIGANWLALVLGHVIGGLLLWGAGLVGAKARTNAMESTRGTFGAWGMCFFALLNIVQLVGWTAVMVAQGARAVGEMTEWNGTATCYALAALVAVWIFIALGDRFHLATIGMVLLAILSVVLTVKLLGAEAIPTDEAAAGEPVDFLTTFELSLAMPLSWLPLISDYTSNAERPRAATAVSAVVYTLASLWMYALGAVLAMRGAVTVPEGITIAGLGMIGLFVIVFSTITTTFLDAFSAGESARAICPRLPSRAVGVAVCAIGGILAAAGIMDNYIDFLYFISSVFAPMAAVLLVDRFVTRRGFAVWNLVAWLGGFLVFQHGGIPAIGPTMSAMLASALLALGAIAFKKA